MAFDVTKEIANLNITVKELNNKIENYSSSTDNQAKRMGWLTWALVFVGAVQAIATVVQVIVQWIQNP